jgi:hypothetical protein
VWVKELLPMSENEAEVHILQNLLNIFIPGGGRGGGEGSQIKCSKPAAGSIIGEHWATIFL